MDELNVPDTVYVKFHGMDNYPFNAAQCDVPCQAINDVCFELVRTGACAWQGTLLQNATCYPVSTMSVNISCTASSVTLTAIWIQSGSAIARFVKVINGPPQIDCLGCTPHELNNDLAIPGDATAGNRCRPNSGYVELAFVPFTGCCQYCPEQMQISITGIEEDNAGENKCGEEDCGQLNLVYLLDFVGTGGIPFVPGCPSNETDWCEWSTDSFAFRCTQRTSAPHPYGFCELHLYMRTGDNCLMDVLVLLRFDNAGAGDQCASATNYQGWRAFNIVANCNTLDLTWNMQNQRCQDSNWMCTDDDTLSATPTMTITVP